MNYYERIQEAINYIENNLEGDLSIEEVAAKAFMSQANLYRMFFSMVGYKVKEYIRLRRLSKAAACIKENHTNILEIALTYGYDSHTAFTKAFKRYLGMTPKAYQRASDTWSFEKKELLHDLFDQGDLFQAEAYPDIKVIKTLPPMTVAYYHYMGTSPEAHAFEGMKKWMKDHEHLFKDQPYRIFGYNNPDPKTFADTYYGYEVCVTLREQIILEGDSLVKTKLLPGGPYAVCSVKDLVLDGQGKEIIAAWKRLNQWLQTSRYTYGGHQYLEEHLEFDQDFAFVKGMDIYMPIKEK